VRTIATAPDRQRAPFYEPTTAELDELAKELAAAKANGTARIFRDIDEIREALKSEPDHQG